MSPESCNFNVLLLTPNCITMFCTSMCVSNKRFEKILLCVHLYDCMYVSAFANIFYAQKNFGKIFENIITFVLFRKNENGKKVLFF